MRLTTVNVWNAANRRKVAPWQLLTRALAQWRARTWRAWRVELLYLSALRHHRFGAAAGAWRVWVRRAAIVVPWRSVAQLACARRLLKALALLSQNARLMGLLRRAVLARRKSSLYRGLRLWRRLRPAGRQGVAGRPALSLDEIRRRIHQVVKARRGADEVLGRFSLSPVASRDPQAAERDAYHASRRAQQVRSIERSAQRVAQQRALLQAKIKKTAAGRHDHLRVDATPPRRSQLNEEKVGKGTETHELPYAFDDKPRSLPASVARVAGHQAAGDALRSWSPGESGHLGHREEPVVGSSSPPAQAASEVAPTLWIDTRAHPASALSVSVAPFRRDAERVANARGEEWREGDSASVDSLTRTASAVSLALGACGLSTAMTAEHADQGFRTNSELRPASTLSIAAGAPDALFPLSRRGLVHCTICNDDRTRPASAASMATDMLRPKSVHLAASGHSHPLGASDLRTNPASATPMFSDPVNEGNGERDSCVACTASSSMVASPSTASIILGCGVADSELSPSCTDGWTGPVSAASVAAGAPMESMALNRPPCGDSTQEQSIPFADTRTRPASAASVAHGAVIADSIREQHASQVDLHMRTPRASSIAAGPPCATGAGCELKMHHVDARTRPASAASVVADPTYRTSWPVNAATREHERNASYVGAQTGPALAASVVASQSSCPATGREQDILHADLRTHPTSAVAVAAAPAESAVAEEKWHAPCVDVQARSARSTSAASMAAGPSCCAAMGRGRGTLHTESQTPPASAGLVDAESSECAVAEALEGHVEYVNARSHPASATYVDERTRPLSAASIAASVTEYTAMGEHYGHVPYVDARTRPASAVSTAADTLSCARFGREPGLLKMDSRTRPASAASVSMNPPECTAAGKHERLASYMDERTRPASAASTAAAPIGYLSETDLGLSRADMRTRPASAASMAERLSRSASTQYTLNENDRIAVDTQIGEQPAPSTQLHTSLNRGEYLAASSGPCGPNLPGFDLRTRPASAASAISDISLVANTPEPEHAESTSSNNRLQLPTCLSYHASTFHTTSPQPMHGSCAEGHQGLASAMHDAPRPAQRRIRPSSTSSDRHTRPLSGFSSSELRSRPQSALATFGLSCEPEVSWSIAEEEITGSEPSSPACTASNRQYMRVSSVSNVDTVRCEPSSQKQLELVREVGESLCNPGDHASNSQLVDRHRIGSAAMHGDAIAISSENFLFRPVSTGASAIASVAASLGGSVLPSGIPSVIASDASSVSDGEDGERLVTRPVKTRKCP